MSSPRSSSACRSTATCWPLGWHRVGEVADERAEWLRRQGAEIESGPKEYWYQPEYYAVFFYDPDGIKLEIVHVPDHAA